MEWIKNHPALAAVLGLGAVAGIAVVLVWFQPQTLFIDQVVDDTIPTAAPTTTVEPMDDEQMDDETTTTIESMDDDPPTDTTTTTEPAVEYPIELGAGQFIDLAHAGTGTARILELEDGSRILRFENLDVDNGPDLRVILSTSELVDDDAAYDDGDFVDLGELKGNQGNQNYEIPAGTDLGAYPTVAIWCRRFNVTFNAAPISGA